jgi:hypothetical protein
VKTYLIGYDLNRPVQNYPDLIAAIKELGSWWHHLDSTWIVKSDEASEAILGRLKPHIDANDELLVIRVMRDAYWTGFNEQGSKWLLDNLE